MTENVRKEIATNSDRFQTQQTVDIQTDGVCNKCKHEYLVQQNDGYYISKCKKGFDECSKGTIKYCEDFELKSDD